MRQFNRPTWIRALLSYGLAFISVVFLVMIHGPLDRVLGVGVGPFTLVFPAVLIASWFGGLGPGLAATAFGAVAAPYFLIDPVHSFKFASTNVALRLALFLLLSAFTSFANEARRRAREAERKHQEWLQILLTSIGDGVIATDSASRITFLNPVAESLTGWTEPEALSKPLDEVFNTINEQTRLRLPSPVEEVVREGGIAGPANHTILIARDGTEASIENKGAPLKGIDGKAAGVVLTFRDITEHIRAKQADTRISKIVESISDGFYTVDREWRFTYVNRRMERLSGRHADQLIGRNLWNEFRNEVGPAGCDALQRAMTERVSTHFESNVAGGLWYEADVDPTADGLSVFVREITGRKQAEAERERLLRQEQAARKEAEAASRMKDEFLATVSHELRSPLNAIVGWSTILRAGLRDQETIDRAVQAIDRNARMQSQLISDLLDVSRIVAGKFKLEVQPVEIAAIAMSAIDVVRPAADAKGIELKIAPDDAVGTVCCDPGRMQQVMWNLLSNAVKFTPPGGRVHIFVRRKDTNLEIAVSDSGEGISQEFLPHVFDRFRQADGSLTRNHGGLGLGLAIVRHLVELHGGTVEAESPGEGQGSIFTVRLPLLAGGAALEPGHAGTRQLPDELAGQRGDPLQPGAVRKLQGLRVLVVDDDPDSLEVVGLALQLLGAEVQSAATAHDALDIFERWTPNVLISDVGMPIESGYDLIRKIRARPAAQGGSVPAIALTGYAEAEVADLARAAGYQIHLVKPADSDQLARFVTMLAGR
jgi:PAS domain S-box-containing protein